MAHIVLIGAGWTGLSSLGFLLTQLGYTNIIGIDSTPWQISQQLETAGVHMIYGHGHYVIQADDIVIYSDACPRAPEVIAAQELYAAQDRNSRTHVQPPYSYFAFLGEISKHFTTIAVAGTHGKSTTTALLTYTLSQTDPLFWLGILGALVPQLNNTNYWIDTRHLTDIQKIFHHIFTGERKHRDESLRKKYRFAIEADEFNRHFLSLDVDHAIILNAELDHSDIYANEEIYMETFLQFISRVKQKVYMLSGEKGIEEIVARCAKKPHLYAKIFLVNSESSVDISLGHLFGVHNIKNALLAYTLCTQANITSEKILQAYTTFTWLRRRMEFLQKTPNGAFLYTDYGHHPSELAAVYQAMRGKYPNHRLHLIFQPHQARRVLQFREPFVETVRARDSRTLYSLYTARENIAELLIEFPSSHITSDATIDQIGETFANSCNALYTKDFDFIKNTINQYGPDDLICICSAWNLDFQIRWWLEEKRV
jgi:UDP-N-acetylmuramate--alanine ligase